MAKRKADRGRQSGDGKRETEAPTLTKATRLKIAKYAAANPDLSAIAIADHFKCTTNQVSYAKKAAFKGTLKRKSTKSTRSLQAEMIKSQKSNKEIYEEQFHYALAQMEANKNIDPLDRIAFLNKLARTEKIRTDHEMQLHLRGLDWQTFVEAVKMLKPDSSEKEIIRIYNEAKERCKVSQD